MESQSLRPETNYVLAALLQEDRRLLAEQLELVRLRAGQVLGAPGQRVHHVHFPTTAVVSMLALSESGAASRWRWSDRRGWWACRSLPGAIPCHTGWRCAALAWPFGFRPR